LNPEPECHLIRRWISQLEDQELPPERVTILESHLDHCSGCRNWYEEFQHGMDALDLGVVKVSGEIDQLLTGTLVPSKLSPPGESEEITRAADRAAPRLAALAAGVLVLISIVAWGIFPGFRWDALWRGSAPAGNLSLASLQDDSLIEIDGQEQDLSQDGATGMVEIGTTIRCRSGAGEIVDSAGRVITISAGTYLVLTSESSVTLINGLARFEVPPGKGGLVVITEEVTTRVLGTTFEVERWASRYRSEVRVIDGSVAVVRGERIPLPLHTGERVEVTRHGLMFHALRSEGATPLPRASLGGAVEGQIDGNEAPPAIDRNRPGEREEPSREGNLPLDLPVNQRRGGDPDGED